MSDLKNRNNSFDTSQNEKKKPDEISHKIKAEVENLSKKKTLSPSDIEELYRKYGNEEKIVSEILYQRTKRFNKIKEQARHFAEKVLQNNRENPAPLHEILDRALKYKEKKKWSDVEFDEFRKELIYKLTGKGALEFDLNQHIFTNRSRINRTLGNNRIENYTGLNIKNTEHSILNEIFSMQIESSHLHNSAFMHSLLYTDCSLVALSGEYKREKHIASNYIHPLLICMFIPKFDIFEVHMIYSNFGNIIKLCSEKKPIITEPDALLFYDITTDPNDVVCEINSPITDLRNRYQVQIALWNIVIHLRNGNYYEAGPNTEFLSALYKCRNNLYDNADLAYGQDEGAILRKLFSVFSFRPTFIYTKPIYSIATYGISMNESITPYPFNNQPFHTITSVPMITVQIPPTSATMEPVDLRAALHNQTIWITENKTIVPKEQAIIYSKEVLIFYVNRRSQAIQIKTFANPIMFSHLPLSMSNFDHVNVYPIVAPERITLNSVDETFLLRSVVAVTETEIVRGEKVIRVITGCTGLIVKHQNIPAGIYESTYYLYDPYGASIPIKSDNSGWFTNKPISMIEPYYAQPVSDDGIVNLSFADRVSKFGTIFIYAKPSGYSSV